MAGAPLSEEIKVFVRMRDKLPREQSTPDAWRTNAGSDNNSIVSVDGQKSFVFDRVFSPADKNNDVYNVVSREIVESAVKGMNATIFAYGQTGSGTFFVLFYLFLKWEGLIVWGLTSFEVKRV